MWIKGKSKKQSKNSYLNIHKGGMRKYTKSIIVKKTCAVCGEKVRKEYLKEHTERRHLGPGFYSRQTVCSELDYHANSREQLEVRYNYDQSDFHADSKSNLMIR